jgi:hypothetical protein
MQQQDPSAADSDAYEDDPYAELDAIAEQQQREEHDYYAAEFARAAAKPTKAEKREGRKLRARKRLHRSSGVAANGSTDSSVTGSDDATAAVVAVTDSVDDSSSSESESDSNDSSSASSVSQQQQQQLDEQAKK